MILQELKQKNDEIFHYVSKNYVLFKIRKMISIPNPVYVFFDFTYEKTKFYSFDTLDKAKDTINNRFNNYVKKYEKGKENE